VKSERLLREKLRKRRINLFKKVNELARMTDSKIYIVIQYNDKYHIYKSIEESNWPLPEREIISYAWSIARLILTKDNRGNTNTSARGVLGISIVLN